MKKRIEQLKKKRPGYGEILDFYQKVKEAQDKAKASLRIDPIKLEREWKELLTQEGFSLIRKEDFPLDIKSSVKILETLCQIGKNANPHMAEQVGKIGEAFDNKKIDLNKLLKKGVKEQGIDQIADELELDKKVFSFLIQSSIKPSIEAGMEQLRSELDPETWLKGHVAKPPIAEHVDDDRPLEFLPVLGRNLGGEYNRFGIIAVHVEDERLDHLGDIGRIRRRARIPRISSESDLVIDDEMQRAPGAITL